MPLDFPPSDASMRAHFFMAEDNPGDVELLREAIAFSGIAADIEVAVDGELALERLLDPAHAIPDLIILNFNLPRLQGHQVLTAIKESPRYLGVPVVMLTSSDAQRDRLLCRTADAYFVKSGDWKELLRIVRHFQDLLKVKAPIAHATQAELATDRFWQQGAIGTQGTGVHPIADLHLPKAPGRTEVVEPRDDDAD